MTNADRQLLCVVFVALAAMASAWLPTPAPLRVLLGLPLALFLPGFGLLRAASPKGLQNAEASLLAAGLSLALCALAGLGLNAVGRLNPEGWASALGGFTLLCCAVATFRGGAQAARPGPRLSASHAAMFAISLVVAALGVRYAAVALQAHREFQFTQFWMIPRGADDRSVVTIGLRNEEAAPMTYDVVVASEKSVLGRWPSIDVAPGQTWTTDFAINGPLRSRRVEAWLSRADAPDEVYRKVWIAPVAATPNGG